MELQATTKSQNIQLGIYTAFCVAFMALSVNFPQINASFQSVVMNATTPMLKLIEKPSEWVDAVENSVTGHISVYDENKQLKAELSDKQRLVRELAILEHENEELRQLLDMVQQTEGDAIASRVISDKRSTFSHTVLVDVGVQHNVEKGQIVINRDGLVGRVLEVFDETSRILLITDYASRIPVKILEADMKGIARGTNNYNLELVFSEDAKMKIQEGMTVVTTGAGGIFPEGIPVGGIHTVGKHIYIKPDAKIDTLDVVSIQRQKVRGILQ